MGVEIQKIVYYNKSGDLESKKIILPKIINTDISFQLQFGISHPKDIKSSSSSIKEYATPKALEQ